jgi:hypothetical protein
VANFPVLTTLFSFPVRGFNPAVQYSFPLVAALVEVDYHFSTTEAPFFLPAAPFSFIAIGLQA